MFCMTEKGKKVHASFDGKKTICKRNVYSKEINNFKRDEYCKHCARTIQPMTCAPQNKTKWAVVSVLKRTLADFDAGLPPVFSTTAHDREARTILYGRDWPGLGEREAIQAAISEATAGL